ncbi:MAG: amino acid ABC transporter permease [Butyrivibrio sp.]
MAKLFDFSKVFKQLPEILEYLPVTLQLALISMAIAIILGLLIAIIKVKKIPVLRQIAGLYVSIIRGTPIIVQLYIAYFGIPMITKYICMKNGWNYEPSSTSGMTYAIIALSLNEAAYVAETFRAALLSVGTGQIEAANALGMTYFQALRRIILPETLTIALPNLGNSFIGLIKGTSLAFTCAVVEITAQGKIIGGRTYRYFEVYVSLAIIYWILTVIVEQIIKLIEKKTSIPEQVELVKTDKSKEA